MLTMENNSTDIRWEAVREFSDRRKVAYWRVVLPNGANPGNISRHNGQWKANGFRWNESFRPLVPLGMFPNRRLATAAVLRFITEHSTRYSLSLSTR